ncbi:MAG: tetratricopeptide repeat protein, partial [Syntrophaceae bacterium]|nr:tetratricopeptide repeat protein [Syntrophaceae bacterium]
MRTQKDWFDLGVSYGESGLYQEAIEAYKQAIQIQPDNAATHNNLGTAYGKSGLHKESIESYKQAIQIEPNDAAAHFNLGLAFRESCMF